MIRERSESALSPQATEDPLVIALDVGTSSVRALLFDGRGRQMAGLGAQLPYEVRTTADGGVEVDPDALAILCVQALSALHAQMEQARLRSAAVGFCAFWHSILGIGTDDRPTTPIIHLFDTRSAGAARKLAQRIDARQVHARTGCVLHPSYVPAKLLWLSESRPEVFRRTARWMSFGEYFFLKLFGHAVASTSMVSGSGLWNQNENDYDSGILSVLPINLTQLCPVREMDAPQTALVPEYSSTWPAFAGAEWYPALGDGACNNIGADCHAPDRFALMVGTSGAMRLVSEASRMEIPDGLWCYRVDRKRYVLGGALSNGGLVFEWMKRVLALPADNELIEKELAALAASSSGLTIVPLFAGERSPKWRAEARGALTGLSMDTTPIEILHAALRSVALRFREIYELMTAQIGRQTATRSSPNTHGTPLFPTRTDDVQSSAGAPEQVVASGGGLLHSRVWTQMMADALGRPLIACLENEASGRGAALLALERLGAIQHVRELPARMGSTFEPLEAYRPAYEQALARQRWLYRKLFEEDEGRDHG